MALPLAARVQKQQVTSFFFSNVTNRVSKHLSLYSTATQNYWRWVLLRHLTQKIVLLRHLTQGYQHVGIFCVR